MPSVIATSTWPDRVRQDVAPDRAKRARADRLRPQHELALFQRQELGADEASDAHPAGEADHRHDRPDRRAQEGQHREEEKQSREDQHEVHEPHHQRVDGAAVVARRRAERDADQGRDADGHEADRQRNARAVEHAREHVAPELIGPERVGFRGRVEDLPYIGSVRVPRRDARRQQRERHENDDDNPADQRELVSAKRPPEPPHALTGGLGARPLGCVGRPGCT
jgi:hypothetical protein